ncbi:MAG: GIY-YIG nuclease family protein [Firmicutes bacterium]|nr:GIY-YIG nuclease family protein [Bacillota bacterium]
MDRRRELKEEYRLMKPAMGVFRIHSEETGKCYLEGTTNLRASMNRAIFQLNFGSHPNLELQSDWKKWGQKSFSITVIDELPYNEDDTSTDYKDEVVELKEIWEEKLKNDGFEFY